MQAYDEQMLHYAFSLAERGRGYVEPNPMVGAVIVKNGAVIGEGWHEQYGQAHAEVNALKRAGPNAKGATLYVTLEPCSHFGKTPPCTEAILRAGLKRVVAAVHDPFPAVAGRGIAQLKAAGVEVAVNVATTRARWQNAPYFKLLRTGQPYVLAKWAMSLDGKIATRTGESKWISGEESRQCVHALRGRMDAVVIGSGTALADDPLLTSRPPGPRVAARVVLDSQLKLPLTSQLVKTIDKAPVLLFHAADANASFRETLQNAGCECIVVSRTPTGLNIPEMLADLGRRRFTNILVEGGSALLGSLFDAGAIDEVYAFIAPIILGGEGAPSPIGGSGLEKMADAKRLIEWRKFDVGDDWLCHGRIIPPGCEGTTGNMILDAENAIPPPQVTQHHDASASQDPDLAAVAAAWPTLSPEARQHILDIIRQ
jgi:diaminohydroxyphosphoribosylaminopyrimidine deaminase / 5-amino-6-(5-phosphoribosylamino)uracil reductase